MSTETFTFEVESTDPSVPLKLAVWINDECCLAPTQVNEALTFKHEINDDDEKEYTVRIEMSGKTDEHTKIDEQGNIVKDALLKFKNFEIMGISIDTVMHTGPKYRHNHNGHSDEVEQNFALAMGCNGNVEFKFTTPIYMWLLEHL